MSVLTAALRYAARGLHVFPVWAWNPDGTCRCGTVDTGTGPCRSGKHPVGHLVPHGLQQASVEPTDIRHWWPEGAAHGVAIRTGGSLWVLDEDERGAADGLDLPLTLTVGTPSGGRHFWLRGDGVVNTVRLIPGCDTRGEGGYVLAPPTPGYTWLVRAPIAEAPIDLLRRLARPRLEPRTAPVPVRVRNHGGSRFGLAVLRRACERIEATKEGTRHLVLRARARLVAGYVASGELEEGVARRCLSMAAGGTGLPDHQVEQAIAWAFESGMALPLAKPRRAR